MDMHFILDAVLRAFVCALLICAFFPVRYRFVRQMCICFAVSLGIAIFWSR